MASACSSMIQSAYAIPVAVFGSLTCTVTEGLAFEGNVKVRLSRCQESAAPLTPVLSTAVPPYEAETR